jgi:hypothetical protein
MLTHHGSCRMTATNNPICLPLSAIKKDAIIQFGHAVPTLGRAVLSGEQRGPDGNRRTARSPLR